jgi:hypothetical protein
MNLAELLDRHLPAFYRTYGDRCTPSMQQAIDAIQRCHTASCGHSRWQCMHCDLQEEHPLSCGHRSCPRCQHQTTRQWLARQQTKLLPVDYFMVTLTLPCQLRSLAWRHQAQVYRAMFRVAAGLLKDFAARSPRMGDDIGFTAVLHTHSRKLDYHPHLHLVVPGGSYDPRRRHWRKIRQRYLFNARALARVWRARLLAALRDARPAWCCPRHCPNSGSSTAAASAEDCRHSSTCHATCTGACCRNATSSAKTQAW